MHFLTKFLVVVAAVLGVLLAGLSVAATANKDAVAGEVREARSNYEAARTQVDAQQERMALQRERLERRIEEAQQSEADAEAEVERLRGALNEVRRRLSEAEGARERFNSQIESFQALIATLEETDAERAAEIRDLRESEIEAARREIALSDQINELAGQLEVARETNRALLEENTRLREVADGGAVGSGESVARGARRAPADLNALVNSVSDDPRGDELIGVDAGSQDGLEERMGLVVVRDGRFIATLVLERVGLNESVARVDVLQDGERVRRGDRVIADRR